MLDILYLLEVEKHFFSCRNCLEFFSWLVFWFFFLYFLRKSHKHTNKMHLVAADGELWRRGSVGRHTRVHFFSVSGVAGKIMSFSTLFFRCCCCCNRKKKKEKFKWKSFLCIISISTFAKTRKFLQIIRKLKKKKIIFLLQSVSAVMIKYPMVDHVPANKWWVCWKLIPFYCSLLFFN